MKNLILLLTVVSLTVFVSCGGDSEEDMKVDCSNSDLSITLDATVNATCTENGSFTVSATGGSGSIVFTIDGVNLQSSGVFSVSQGDYTVTAIDGTDCTATANVTVGIDGNGVTITSVSSTQSSCGTSTGSLEITASGGDGNFMYSIDGGSNFGSSNTFNNLEADIYSIVVKDGEGCEDSDSEQIRTGTSLDADVMPIISANCAVSGCHDGSSGSRPDFRTKSGVIAEAGRIKSRATPSNASMPPAGRTPLTQNEKDLIACWVDDGALDN